MDAGEANVSGDADIRAVALEGPAAFALIGKIDDAFQPSAPIVCLKP